MTYISISLPLCSWKGLWCLFLCLCLFPCLYVCGTVCEVFFYVFVLCLFPCLYVCEKVCVLKHVPVSVFVNICIFFFASMFVERLFYVFVYFFVSLFAEMFVIPGWKTSQEFIVFDKDINNHFVIISVFLDALISRGPGCRSTDQYFFVLKIGILVANIGS